MKMRVFIGLIFVISVIGRLYAQDEIIQNIDFENAIENLLPQQELDVDYNDLYDRLFSIYSNPINLNSAERADFQSLFMLREEQITDILVYREEFGQIYSPYELLTLSSIDSVSLKRLLPFITTESKAQTSLLQKLKKPQIHDLFVRYQTVLEQKKGYTDPDTLSSGRLTSRYAGGPSRFYARYLYSGYDKYSFGFTIEKDPGEKITWDPETHRYGMDYYSFHAMIRDVGIFERIIVGDFSMDFGQGLVFGSGLRFGKGTETITTIRRNNLGLRPYRSVFEHQDFSGIALSLGRGLFRSTVFYSQARRDAIIYHDSSNIEEAFFSTIQTIGLHRTSSEIAAKHSIKERSAGANISVKSRNRSLEIGINGVYTGFDFPLRPEQKAYNRFRFSGRDQFLGSLYANYYLRGAHIFGEMAVSDHGAKALSAGVIASLSPQVQAAFHLRRYDKDFYSFHGSAFGENTRIGNENGMYWGLKLFPIPNLTISTYLDLYQFPWLKYRVDRPSEGNDFMVSGEYQIQRDTRFRLIYRRKQSELNFQEEDANENYILPKTIDRLSLLLNHRATSSILLQTRLQFSRVDFNEDFTSGFLIAQDVNYARNAWSLSGRIALFDAENYDNRQFAYERDVLYLYNIPSFYNKGIRYYLVAKYAIFKRMDIWIKISQTKYMDQMSIGSGLEEIEGNRKTSINAQIRLKL